MNSLGMFALLGERPVLTVVPAPPPPKATRKPPKARPPKPLTPWSLTARECEVMAALLLDGNNKDAGRRLGVEPKTIEAVTKTVRRRMEAALGSPVSRIQAAVFWDRFVRSKEPT